MLAAGLMAQFFSAGDWQPLYRDCDVLNRLRIWAAVDPSINVFGIKGIRLRVRGPDKLPNGEAPALFAEVEDYAVRMVRSRIAELDAAADIQVWSSRIGQPAPPTLAACQVVEVDVAFSSFTSNSGANGNTITGSYRVTTTRPAVLSIRGGKTTCAPMDTPPLVTQGGPFVIDVDQSDPNAIVTAAEKAIRGFVDYSLIHLIYHGSDRAVAVVRRLITHCATPH
jgi:hypothetical protein